MSKPYGLDMPAIFGTHLGPAYRTCTFTKVTPGTRSASDPTAGTNPTETPYEKAQGTVSDYRNDEIDGTLIKRGDREVRILSASLPAGVVPHSMDKVTIDGETYRIADVAFASGQAVYVCNARKS